MNGIHDMGGMHGLGAIVRDPGEPLFSADWERRIFGLFFAVFAGGYMNVDEFRHAIERMDAVHYLEGSYYEHWIHSIETMLVEKNVLSRDEIERRIAQLRENNACES